MFSGTKDPLTLYSKVIISLFFKFLVSKVMSFNSLFLPKFMIKESVPKIVLYFIKYFPFFN